MKKQLFKNIFSLGTVQLVNYIFPLVTVPYISRIIGPDSYGIINYAAAFIAYFTLLIGYGFDLTGTRKIARNPDDNEYVSRVFSEVLNARILLFVVSCALFAVSILLSTPLNQNLFIAFVLFFSTISAVLTPQFVFQGKQHLTIFAILNFVKGLLYTILIFVFIRQKSDFVIIPVLTVSIGLISAIFLLIYAFKKFQLRYIKSSFNEIFKLLNDEKIIFFSMVVISLYTTTNTVVLGFFASAEEVGYFTVSNSLLSVIISVISVPIATAFYPYIGNAFAENKEDGLNVLKKIFPVIGYLTFVAGVLLFIFAPLIISIIYGNKFHNSIAAFRIMAFIPFIVSMSNIFGIQTMLNLNMDKIFLKVTFIASIIGLMLNIFMSKYFNYIGTAWNTLIIETFVTIYMYFLLKKNDIHLFEKEYFSIKYVYKTATQLLKKEEEE